MHHSRDERKDGQSSFNREFFRQVCMARMENMENVERDRRRRWISAASSSRSSQSMISSRPPLVDLNNSVVANNQNDVAPVERSRNVTSIEISSPAKHKLWLLGQRYSFSSSYMGDAQSIVGSFSSSSSGGTQSIAGPVSPPSLRNRLDKRIGNLDNPLQLLLLHASQHENEVASVERDKSINNEDCNTPVQGGHLLQLLNQLARSNHAQQPTQSPPRHLDVTMNSTDDDDGSSMLSNVSSFIFSERKVDKCHQNEEDDDKQEESDYFSSFCKVQSMLSELNLDENNLQSNASVEKKNSEDSSETLENEDWGLLSCIAFSILVIVSILLALSVLFSLQAKVDTWKESVTMRLWEIIGRYETSGLDKLKELYSFRSSASGLLHNWAESMARQFSEMMERYETLYLNTLNDLLHQRSRVFASLSLNNVTSLLMQQLKRLSKCATSYVDVTSVAIEQLYRVAKAYYSAIELFRTAQSSIIELHASTALAWNTTLLIWQQAGVIISSKSKEWLVAPLSYSTLEHFPIGKTSLTTPIIKFDVGIGHYRNDTIRYQEEKELEEKEMSLQVISPPFWRQQSRAFVKPNLPCVEMSLITQPSISHLENVGYSCIVSDNLTTLVVQRMRSKSKQPSKPKKQRGVRDYYASLIQQGNPDEKDIFDGVDIMSMASDAIVRWWHQHW
jgi:hypothetical protein